MTISGLNLGGADKNETPTKNEPTEDKNTPELTNAVNKDSEVSSTEPAARWSCHPIQRYTVGDYRFESGLLTLATEKEADEFQAMYDELPIYEQTRLTKIDLSAAEAIARAHMATNGGATRGIDSATGDRAPNNQVGTGSLISE